MFASLSKTGRSFVAAGVVSLALAGAPARAETLPPTPKAFVLIEYQVLDQALFLKLREELRATLKTYKGDLVMREKVAPIFGGNPTNISVIGFPTMEAAKTWLASKDLAAIIPDRDKAAKVTSYLVEKLD